MLERLERKVAGAVAIHFDEFFGGLHVVAHPPAIDAYRELFVCDPRSRLDSGLLGEHDPAIGLLRESFTQGLPYGLYLHNDPDFDGLRNRTACQQLVQPVN